MKTKTFNEKKNQEEIIKLFKTAEDKNIYKDFVLNKNDEFLEWERDLTSIILKVNRNHSGRKNYIEIGRKTLKDYTSSNKMNNVHKKLENIKLNQVTEIYEFIQEILYEDLQEDLQEMIEDLGESTNSENPRIHSTIEIFDKKIMNQYRQSEQNYFVKRIIVRYLRIFVITVIHGAQDRKSRNEIFEKSISDMMKEKKIPNFKYITDSRHKYNKDKRDQCNFIQELLFEKENNQLECKFIFDLIRGLVKEWQNK